jgi:hypothetical protein
LETSAAYSSTASARPPAAARDSSPDGSRVAAYYEK